MESDDKQNAGSLLARSVENFMSVLGVWHPRLRERPIHAGISDAVVPIVLIFLVQWIGLRILDPYTTFSIDVLNGYAGSVALSVIALLAGLFLLRRSGDIPGLTVGVLWSLMIGSLLSTAAYSAVDLQGTIDWILRGVIATYAFPVTFLGCRLGLFRGAVASVVFMIPAALSALSMLSYYLDPGEPRSNYVPPDTEMIHAAQPGLLAAQIKDLRPGDPDKVELFALLGAGYPHEGVFRREVEAVAGQLSKDFQAADRVISLVNSDDDLASYPLLNRVNLKKALNALAGAMNEDDLLFLFLTSHGNAGRFSVSFPGVISRDLNPADLSLALQDAGIKNAVIVVSACFSGSFVDALSGPDRLVLTAADAESSSFGCNDQNEWTEWGRAFFAEAWKTTKDPRKAARLAKASVREWETARGLDPSSPMIVEGAAIGTTLDRWLADLEPSVQN